MSAAFTSMYPQATVALVPAQAAEDCLKSVPIDKTEDLALIEEMKYYINWQSNLAYLLDPPEGYAGDRVDTHDEIERITNDLENDKYENEYTLMFDLQSVITKSYDFHFAFAPDITQVFRFRRGNIGRGLLDEFALVSVSKDGKELPKLYNYYDIIVGEEEGWTPSPVSQINNQSAEDYVQQWSTNFVFHEDHARYNMLFPSQPQQSMGERLNQFGRSFIPDGDYTTVKHENGTINQYINNAIIELDVFEGVEDGDTFFQRFCNLGPPQTSSRKRSAKRDLIQEITESVKYPTKAKRQSTAEATPTGFPAPEMYHSEGVVGGYYLTSQGYTDVAVLSVPSFMPSTAEGPLEFQEKVGSFLQDATKAGKKKLVIDLRGNGGGMVFLGYDMFKQLFPSEDPYGASQFRANDAFDGVGKALSELFDQEGITFNEVLADYQAKGVESTLAVAWQSIFNWRLPLSTDNKNFTSWEEFFGPHERHNDKWTTVSRKDLNNPFSDDLGLDVTGYGERISALNKDQPFTADNIVLLQDGGCGSTCAVFSEFMKAQGNVQQVVVGGTPKTGPMQGVAGSKGSQVYTWTQVFLEAYRVYDLLPDQQEEFNKTELGALVNAQRPLMRSAYGATGQTQSVVNLRDNIRMNDEDVTPLEFVYEAADCRLFYTGDMVRDVEAVWKKAADARWGNTKDVCVEDSTGHASSLSGGAKPQQGNQGSTKDSAAVNLGGSGFLTAAAIGFFALFMM
ncbi:Nn.00g075660.m01.CDS01 [Neocucurbitaria sp. VM-36]